MITIIPKIGVMIKTVLLLLLLGSALLIPTIVRGQMTNRDQINLNKVTWLHTNVSGWSRTARITNVKIRDVPAGGICIKHTKSGEWPGTQTGGGANLAGNPWIFARKNGRWYAATYEWLRPRQTCKLTVKGSHSSPSQELGPHIKKSPLDTWVPRPGETVGFMVSTPARSGAEGPHHERSNVVLVTWPGDSKPLPLSNLRNMKHIIEGIKRNNHEAWRATWDIQRQKYTDDFRFLNLVVEGLRDKDTRFGYNCVRGNCNRISADAVAYYRGNGNPQNSTDVVIIDFLAGQSDGSTPQPAWTDVTEETRRKGAIGRWKYSRTENNSSTPPNGDNGDTCGDPQSSAACCEASDGNWNVCSNPQSFKACCKARRGTWKNIGCDNGPQTSRTCCKAYGGLFSGRRPGGDKCYRLPKTKCYDLPKTNNNTCDNPQSSAICCKSRGGKWSGCDSNPQLSSTCCKAYGGLFSGRRPEGDKCYRLPEKKCDLPDLDKTCVDPQSSSACCYFRGGLFSGRRPEGDKCYRLPEMKCYNLPEDKTRNPWTPFGGIFGNGETCNVSAGIDEGGPISEVKKCYDTGCDWNARIHSGWWVKKENFLGSGPVTINVFFPVDIPRCYNFLDPEEGVTTLGKYENKLKTCRTEWKLCGDCKNCPTSCCYRVNKTKFADKKSLFYGSAFTGL